MRFSYTGKLTLQVPAKEFYRIAIPLVNKTVLHKAVTSELYQCFVGIVDGDRVLDDWRVPFYQNLLNGGFIDLTEYGESKYPDKKIDM